MKFIYLFCLSMMSYLYIAAQAQPSILYGTNNYQALQQGVFLTTPANLGEFWDDICYDVNLSQPVTFNSYSLLLTNMSICSDGKITLYDSGRDFSYTLMPFHAEYIDKRVDETLLDASDILYHTANGFTTIEYRNVASRVEYGWYGTVESYFNFQVRIEHATGNVKFYYGASSYSAALWDIVVNTNEIAVAGLSIKPAVGNFGWIMTGEPNNFSVFYIPVFTGNNYPSNRLHEIPLANLTIDFVWEASSSIRNTTNELEASIFPNPSTGDLTLLFKGSEADLTIFDLAGRQQFQVQDVESKSSYAVNHLTSGTYIVKITSNDGVSVLKWVKN
jgi:hypothetical protein